MKILLVNTRHFRGGGDSTYTLNLANLLRSMGHQVAFFAMQDQRNLPDPNSDLFVSHIDFRQAAAHKDLITGLQVLERAIYSREAKRKIGRLLDRFQPDIVHIQNIHGHITPSIIFEAKAHNLPVVWTLHDYKMICPNTHFLIDRTGEICESCRCNSYYQAILKRCKKDSLLASGVAALEAYAHRLIQVRENVDIFLSPSVFLNNKLIEHGFPPEKIRHLPYTLSTENFQDNPGRNEGYLLFLGKLETLKGIFPLLEACRLIPKIKLILAGQVEETLASKLSTLLPVNAQYVGVQQGKDLQHLLNNALALVLPSIWYENQPLSILEAFACGKPVIASSIGGMTELVKHQERGLLVKPGDALMLAEAIAWMTNRPEMTKAMGQNAYQYALKVHQNEQHYVQLMQVYKDARR